MEVRHDLHGCLPIWGNVYQLVGSVNPDIRVIRNDECSVDEIRAMNPSHIILSPGPGRPDKAGVCENVIRELGGRIPILGICLGHQAICEVAGATVTYASHLMHGKQSLSDFRYKNCFIITFSKHLSWLREKKMIEKFSGVLFLALHAMIPMAIIHIQGDDGTVLIFALMFLVMTFAAGVQLRYFVIFGGLLVCAIPIIWNMFMNEEHRNRVLALFPWRLAIETLP